MRMTPHVFLLAGAAAIAPVVSLGAGSSASALSTAATSTLQPADSAEYQRIIDRYGDALVAVKLVLKFEGGGFGDGGERETETVGVMIDPKGIVMCSSLKTGGMPNQGFPPLDVGLNTTTGVLDPATEDPSAAGETPGRVVNAVVPVAAIQSEFQTGGPTAYDRAYRRTRSPSSTHRGGLPPTRGAQRDAGWECVWRTPTRDITNQAPRWGKC